MTDIDFQVQQLGWAIEAQSRVQAATAVLDYITRARVGGVHCPADRHDEANALAILRLEMAKG
jgi:hypothetical protein